jgi:hypothetical protein
LVAGACRGQLRRCLVRFGFVVRGVPRRSAVRLDPSGQGQLVAARLHESLSGGDQRDLLPVAVLLRGC